MLLANPGAWQAQTIDESAAWYHTLSERALSALDSHVYTAREAQPITEHQASPNLRAACADDVGPILKALEAGRGFVIIRPDRPNRYTPREQQIVYWLLGHLLGLPMQQNVQGTLLYDVRDTGQDVRYGARFSVTNASSTFHTDNSFGREILDYVGLLCLNPAQYGGESQLVSGQAVQEALLANHPGVCDILCQPFHVDRRGGVLPGEEPTAHVPIFNGAGSALVMRYLRYWIEVGQEKAGLPLNAEQTSAMDQLDELASEPQMRVEFTLRPAEMLFVNNRWILHNRTAFQDFPEPERWRHYIRLWVGRT